MNRVDDHLFACHPTLVFGTWSRWEVPNPIEVKSSHDTFHDWTRGQWHAQGISTSLHGCGGALRCRYHVCIVWLLFFLEGNSYIVTIPSMIRTWIVIQSHEQWSPEVETGGYCRNLIIFDLWRAHPNYILQANVFASNLSLSYWWAHCKLH